LEVGSAIALALWDRSL
jgi:hypothetical protein